MEEKKYQSRFYRYLCLLITVILLSGCHKTERWSQFHSDGPNQGFLQVHSAYAIKPKWVLDLNDRGISYSSPVIDKDGNIYVGTCLHLMKVNKNGAVIWSIDFPDSRERELSSPAIGQDGNIYFVTLKILNLNDRQFSYSLHSISPDGLIRWSRDFGTTTDIINTASTKTWGNEKNVNIFVCFKKLYVFDQEGHLLAAKDVRQHCTTVIGTSWFTDFYQAIGNFFKAIFEGNGIGDYVSSGDILENRFGLPDPTPAIYSYPNTSYQSKPLIILANECTVSCIQWNPDNDHLDQLWYKDLPEPKRRTSPAVYQNGSAIIGREDGIVEIFNIETGQQLSQYDIGERLIGTPVSLMGVNTYLSTVKHLFVLAANGNIINKKELHGPTFASPAMSADAIYISTLEGMETFALDCSENTIDSEKHGGGSSPAIDIDGSIYMITIDGFLQAYPGVK
jgi:outer membrane protein assembly factor BamB